MKMHHLAGLLLAGSVFGAHADTFSTTYDLGATDPAITGTFSTTPVGDGFARLLSSGSDLTYSFTLASASDVTISFEYGGQNGALASVAWTGSSPVSFSGATSIGITAGGLTGDPTLSSDSYAATLAAGTYTFKITSTANKNVTLDTLAVSSVTAVPEPETYAMMLAGLGAIGFLSRRRRTQG